MYIYFVNGVPLEWDLGGYLTATVACSGYLFLSIPDSSEPSLTASTTFSTPSHLLYQEGQPTWVEFVWTNTKDHVQWSHPDITA